MKGINVLEMMTMHSTLFDTH